MSCEHGTFCQQQADANANEDRDLLMVCVLVDLKIRESRALLRATTQTNSRLGCAHH
ncbi:hypothetical protein [Chamaesiphon sp.]|uniref:hypothetical protein n=1 Tax=Chamaesiphon sp. TaxID=2814140 RepID=UPI00359467CE